MDAFTNELNAQISADVLKRHARYFNKPLRNFCIDFMKRKKYGNFDSAISHDLAIKRWNKQRTELYETLVATLLNNKVDEDEAENFASRVVATYVDSSGLINKV